MPRALPAKGLDIRPVFARLTTRGIDPSVLANASQGCYDSTIGIGGASVCAA